MGWVGLAELVVRDHLTYRDLQVLSAYARLGSIKDAAYSLDMAHDTAKHHLNSSFAVLGVTTFIDALRALGWLIVPELPNPQEA